ncbi:MAG: ATP-dependent DNA helicase, partial [Candidatus Omnitrophota bacterium]
MNKLSEGLNKEQLEAVTHKQGPLLIIAGAGTGKTTVITHRIAWLLNQGLAKTNEILALTFTDKAASEMQQRIDVLVPYGYTDIWISTFHSFGDRILRENAIDTGMNPDFKVLTKPETAVFFREHLFSFPLKHFRPLSDPTRFIEAIIDLFSRLKDEDISSIEYLEYAKKLKEKSENSPEDEVLKEEAMRQEELALCYAKYQELLFKEGKIDFGNQFYLSLKLLREHPSILDYYQKQFKYILVDEFQDTNFAQFQLIKLLAKNKNVTVVADDDQCIFRFRGAAYSNILSFTQNFPDAKKISLIKNYRSTQSILDSAYQLIQHNNPDRFEVKANIDKRLVSITKEKGSTPINLCFDTLNAEADKVAKIIKEKVKNKEYNYNDFTILVRSNSDADSYLRALNMVGIPWRFSGNQGLYQRDEVRLCISFLRLMANPGDSLSLYYLATSDLYRMPLVELTECLHQAKRKNKSLFWVLENLTSNQELTLSGEANATSKKLIEDVKKYLEYSSNLTTGRLLYLFLTESGYLKKLMKNQTLTNEEKIQNLARFFNIVHNFQHVACEDRVVYFINYLDLLIQAGDDPATQEADLDIQAVNILTIHKAKGLEFGVVFMVSLVMGKFPWPHRRKPLELPDDLIKEILPSGDFHTQEERRLFYVGMTRAKKELYFTYAKDYGTNRMRRVSQFIIEALGLDEKEIKTQKTSAYQAIERNAPPAESFVVGLNKIPDEQILSLSFYQIDDYLTCPLKYKYVHILRVPILEHHTVLYGKALHDAVQYYHQRKMRSLKTTSKELV